MVVGTLLGTVHLCRLHPGTEGSAFGVLNIFFRQGPGDGRSFFVVMETAVGGTKYPKCTPIPDQERHANRQSLVKRGVAQASGVRITCPSPYTLFRRRKERMGLKPCPFSREPTDPATKPPLETTADACGSRSQARPMWTTTAPHRILSSRLAESPK
ncbi:hypothetical protein V5799_022547 [Amblyomma americanum]|uniref:Uncharacterized protein n=1 Tax=Amblyomma americanum TaxID=6943 RepID=A0AAQ4FK78_AMBAM